MRPFVAAAAPLRGIVPPSSVTVRPSRPMPPMASRQVYTREFHDAYYRAGSYVIAKLLTDVPASGPRLFVRMNPFT